MNDFFNDNMYWRLGRYTLSIEIQVKELDTPHTQKFEMELQRVDVETLKGNAERLEAWARNVLAVDAQVANPPPAPIWKTVNVPLKASPVS